MWSNWQEFNFRLSRYWNRFAYLIIDVGKFLVWDYTKRNKDILEDTLTSQSTRSIMTEYK